MHSVGDDLDEFVTIQIDGMGEGVRYDNGWEAGLGSIW